MKKTITSLMLASAFVVTIGMSARAQEVQPGRVIYNGSTTYIDNHNGSPNGFQGYCIWGATTYDVGSTTFWLYDPGFSTDGTLTLPRTRFNNEPTNLNMFWATFNDNCDVSQTNWPLKSGIPIMYSALRRHAQVYLYCTNHTGTWFIQQGFSGWFLTLAGSDTYHLEVTPYNY